MKKTTGCILALHGFVVWMCAFSPEPLHENKKQQRLVVHTVSLKPKTIAEKPAAKQPVQKKQTPVKKAAPPKKIVPLPITKPLPAPQPSTKSSPPPQPKLPQHLLKELEETIAKIDENRDKLYTGKRKEKPLEIDRVDSTLEEVSYRDTLIDYLHEVLHLPDYGEVKIQLSLHKDGRVAQLRVLKAESEKNRNYLEEHLPLLKFPLVSKECTFVLTFCNE